jgi:hypothetical protein
MAYKSKKASATVRQIKDDLGARLGSTFVLSEGVSTPDNHPTLTVSDGTPAPGEDCCFIKVGPEGDVVQSLNAIGGTQDVFTPHVVHVAFEASAASAARANPSMAFITRVMSHLMTLGMKIKVYHETNGTEPKESSIDSTKLKVTIDQLWHPLTSTL